MASVSLLNLSIMGSGLAAGDYFVVGDVSDTTQSASGSDVRISATNFFATIPVPIIITSASANALAVGLAGATNPAFVVDASTATQAAGLKVTGAVAAGTVAMVVISSGSNASLTINAKGTGTIGIGSVSTGAVTITPATTITGALTQTGLATFNGGATIASGQTLTVTSATITGLTAASVGTGTFPGIYTITGAVTLSSTLRVTGDFDVATTKFTVASATGNTVAAGTLKSTGDLTVGASTFVVTAATGAVACAAITSTGVFSTRVDTGTYVANFRSVGTNGVGIRLENVGVDSFLIAMPATTGDLVFKSSDTTERLRISSAGVLTLNAYTAATWVTGDRYLVANASGVVHLSAVGPAS